MSEPQATYTYDKNTPPVLPNQEYAVTKTYSMKMLHIGMASDLSRTKGISQGEVVRNSIERYFRTENDPRLIEMAELTQISKDELLDRAIALLYSRIEEIKSNE